MSQSNQKHNQLIETKDVKSQWIENENYFLQSSINPSNQFDQGLKLQHQHYLKLKNKRRQEAIRKKIEEFGQSSSDEEIQKKQTSLKILKNQQEYAVKKRENQLERFNFAKQQKKESELIKKQRGFKLEKQKQVESQKKIEIFMSYKKGVEMWSKQEMSIQQKSIVFSNINLPFYDLNKYKIIFTVVSDSCYKLKINWKNQQMIFASSFKKTMYQLPTPYFIFAKIIKLKLNLMGRKVASFNDQKSKSSNDSYPKNTLIYGKILKKSRLISRWSEIFVGINKQGLFYHKKVNEKGQLLISRGSISELWTRFEFQDDYLIVKLFENGHKIQLGIPLQDYTNTNSWLYHLYCLSNKNI